MNDSEKSQADIETDVDGELLEAIGNNFVESFANMSQYIHGVMLTKGFWKARREAEEKMGETGLIMAKEQALDLTHSELGEATEAIRTGAMDDKVPEFTGEAAEIADAIIRLMDYAVGYNVPVAEALVAKMGFNKTRPYMHGKKS